MRHSTERRAPRPVRPPAAALSKILSRSWSLPPQRNFVAVERNLRVPMSDGTILLADHYLPIISQSAATVLVRCPYGRGMPFSLLEAQLVAERGYHVLLQSCRGTLDQPVEVIGDVTAELHVTRDNPNADLFVRLCDVDAPGDAHSRSRNVCDGIVRLTDADPLAGTVRVALIGAAHRFGRGHRLRLQVAGGAHPRFARNPGNGQVDTPARDFVITHYSVQSPSALVISQTAGRVAAHA